MTKSNPGAAAKPIRISIANIYMNGAYTGQVRVGSHRGLANLLLDTGSSSLVVDGNFYNPAQDALAETTDLAQEIVYGRGRWLGAVVRSQVDLGGVTVHPVNVAVAYVESKNMFGNANGILGLAYKRLNPGYTLPGPTWPPKFDYNQVQDGKVAFLKPYFSQLERSGMVANKFAFYTRRSRISHAKTDVSRDPLNHGYLILGGGEESTDLYDVSGPFATVRVLDDDWYNTNLKAVIVGSQDPIEVPAPTKASGNLTNSIIDSGTNSLDVAQTLFNAILDRFVKINRRFAQLLRAGFVSMSELNRRDWPNIDFVLEGERGDVRLTVTPQNYWQVNSPERGSACASLAGDGGQLQGRSTLGLPLMNGYFTIFDRSQDRLGAVRFAPRK